MRALKAPAGSVWAVPTGWASTARATCSEAPKPVPPTSTRDVGGPDPGVRVMDADAAAPGVAHAGTPAQIIRATPIRAARRANEWGLAIGMRLPEVMDG